MKQVAYDDPQSDMAVKDVSPAKAYAPARHSSDDVGVYQPLASHDVPLENVVQVPAAVSKIRVTSRMRTFSARMIGRF